MIEFGGIRMADIFACTAMYISNAKSKLPIVRKWRATHAIVTTVVNWKYRCIPRASPCKTIVDFFSVRWRPAKAKSKGYITLRQLACHASIIHTQKVAMHEGAKDAGVAPRRATMPACTDARMHRVLHAFFTLPHIHVHDIRTYVRTYVHTYTYIRTALTRWATFPPCAGVYPSYDRRVIFYIIMEKRMFDIFVFWCMRNITTWEIYRDKMHRSFSKRIYRILCVYSMCLFIYILK